MTPNDLVLTENGTEWICPICTAVIPLDVEYCSNCGQYRGELVTPEPELSLVADHIGEPEPELEPDNQQPQRPNNTALRAAMVTMIATETRLKGV